MLSNISSFHQPALDTCAWFAGLVFSLRAVALWLWFSVINQRQLTHLAAQATGLWTALMMGGAGVATLCLLPTLGFGLSQAGPLYALARAKPLTWLPKATI